MKLIIFFNSIIFILLNLIFIKLLGYIGIYISLCLIIFLHIIIGFLTKKVEDKNKEFSSMHNLNRLDFFLYKIIGDKFIDWRINNETFVDAAYEKLFHFMISKFKIYLLIIIITSIVIHITFSNFLAYTGDKEIGKQNSNYQNNTTVVSQSKQPKNNEYTSNNIKNNKNLITIKKNLIEYLKNQFKDNWKEALNNKLTYCKKNNISNYYTLTFLNKNGTINYDPNSLPQQ